MLATSFLITLVIGSGSAARADVVTDWNQIMLDAITKAGTGISPIVATRGRGDCPGICLRCGEWDRATIYANTCRTGC
jgi:hypothetical protein